MFNVLGTTWSQKEIRGLWKGCYVFWWRNYICPHISTYAWQLRYAFSVMKLILNLRCYLPDKCHIRVYVCVLIYSYSSLSCRCKMKFDSPKLSLVHSLGWLNGMINSILVYITHFHLQVKFWFLRNWWKHFGDSVMFY